MEPGKLVEESVFHSKTELILGGRFLQMTYHYSFEGNQHEGISTIGYYLPLDQWQISWIDTFHNGTNIMFSTSKEMSSLPNVLGEYGFEYESPWGWRTTIELQQEELLIKAYNITPQGEEALALDIRLSRI